MKHGWTGGQYSLFRAVFGCYLFVHFLQLIPYATETFSSSGMLGDGSLSPLLYLFPNILILVDAPWFVLLLIISATLAAIFFIIGTKDKLAALWIWYVLACLFGRNPLTANPSLPFVGWILLAHTLIPGSPYGSRAAAGRVDPSADWQFPVRLFGASWILMSVTYTYSGIIKLASPSWADGSAFYELLQNPLARPGFLRNLILLLPESAFPALTWGALALEILFVPLALFSRTRPVVWLLMLCMHLGLIGLVQFADLSLGMIVLHLFTFNPHWLQASKSEKQEILFYDGECGLCHRWVRFLLSEDTLRSFSLSPLQGDAIKTVLSDEQRAELPDSLVLATEEGSCLTRSAAVIYILNRIGGYWRIIGLLLRLIPRPLRDFGYNLVAAIRHRLFKKPSELCPMAPEEFRKRLLY